MAQKEQKTNGLSFVEYYGEVRKIQPCLEFRERIASVCKVTENTVSRWLSGTYRPDPLKMERISEELGIPVNVLFPEEIKQDGTQEH